MHTGSHLWSLYLRSIRTIYLNSFRNNKFATKQLTSLSIAGIESLIVCPLERLKVHFMTQAQNKRITYRQFFKNNKGNLGKELYRGYNALFARQVATWTIFLQSDLLIKTMIRKYNNMPEDAPLTNKQLSLSVVFVALMNTSIIMPMDVVKTYFQKADPSTKYLDAYKSIYKQGGFFGLFTGFRPRLALNFSNSFFAVVLMEKMDKYAKMAFGKE